MIMMMRLVLSLKTNVYSFSVHLFGISCTESRNFRFIRISMLTLLIKIYFVVGHNLCSIFYQKQKYFHWNKKFQSKSFLFDIIRKVWLIVYPSVDGATLHDFNVNFRFLLTPPTSSDRQRTTFYAIRKFS